jgi:hypothetical protein
MTAFWTLNKSQTIGQITYNSYGATATGGALYRETAEVYDGKQSQLAGAGGPNPSEVASCEASAFVAGGSGALTWTMVDQETYSDRTVSVYQAASGSHTLTKTVTVQNGGTQSQLAGAGTSGPTTPKAIRMSIAVD